MVTALLVIAGCHKKPPASSDTDIHFTPSTLASGSAGDDMAKLATQYEIPVYPGAVPDTSHFNASSAATGRAYLAYTTPDATDRVVTFYKSNMQLGVSTSGAVTLLNGQTHNGSQISITVGQKMDGSGTSFSIVVSPQAPIAYNTSAPAMTAPQTAQPAQRPVTPPPTATPPVPQKDVMSDSATVYVPTSNSPDDGSTSGDQNANNGNDQGNDQQQPPQQTDNNGTPDNGGPPGG